MNALLWFRLDLRLTDNPALDAAVKHGGDVIPVFIWAPEEEWPWEPGAASRWWLHQSLFSLNSNLAKYGSRLILRRGPTLPALQALAKETNASAVFWNRRYEPAAIARDQIVKQILRGAGMRAESFNGALLHEPWTIQNQGKKPFQVFTPFWKNCLSQAEPPKPSPAPQILKSPAHWPKSLALEEFRLLPKIDWAAGFRKTWQPGEDGAKGNLQQFLKTAFDQYSAQRDRPDLLGTSRLSPHLHFGEISPRQIWHHVKRTAEKSGLPPGSWRSSQFINEIGWREFSHHLLFHFPHTSSEPLRPAFKEFPWREDLERLDAWKRGATGFPIVDAGMRELWATGWMHNRVRMVVASFLVKDLLTNWVEGARWFWDTLVDADLAQNTLGWQWTAGCGADAAPYFRIFNPLSQGEKFDPKGGYVRRWCPELARVPDKYIHSPWSTPPSVLDQSGIQLERPYPKPVIAHSIARETALEAFSKIRLQK